MTPPQTDTTFGRGLALWGLCKAQLEQDPLRAVAEAFDAAALSELRSPSSAWTETLREQVSDIAADLRSFADPAQTHSPAVQLSLIVGAINKRTGFLSRFASGKKPKDVQQPLRPVHLATLPAPARNAILQVETNLDHLARDLMLIRIRAAATLR